jgi:hypothetical protein
MIAISRGPSPAHGAPPFEQAKFTLAANGASDSTALVRIL